MKETMPLSDFMFVENGKDLAEVISKETSGDFEKLLLRILQVCYSVTSLPDFCVFHPCNFVLKYLPIKCQCALMRLTSFYSAVIQTILLAHGLKTIE